MLWDPSGQVVSCDYLLVLSCGVRSGRPTHLSGWEGVEKRRYLLCPAPPPAGSHCYVPASPSCVPAPLTAPTPCWEPLLGAQDLSQLLSLPPSGLSWGMVEGGADPEQGHMGGREAMSVVSRYWLMAFCRHTLEPVIL